MMISSGVKKVFNEIRKPANDGRLYRGLILDNEMKVLLMSDSATEKASAALEVGVGNMSDPSNLPGLAHFCEHMLFLGTAKYPQENEYSRYLSEHGGMSNAYTTYDCTCYYFDVSSDHLTGALDRFAQFFLNPLFTESATDREINAVHAENDKNLQQDIWRINQLDKATLKASHPYSLFSTGNRFTLQERPKQLNIDVRQELLNFHSKYYSSNIMNLAVLGRESLDDLQEMVISLFKDVTNKSIDLPYWSEHPMGADEVGKLLYVVPVKDAHSISISWPLPYLAPHYKTNPGHYVSHLFGHEGEGSLLSVLKRKGWATALVSGERPGARGFSFGLCSIELTEKGIEHCDEILLMTFRYLNLLHKHGPVQWIFDECAKLSQINFMFKGKDDPLQATSTAVTRMHTYPMDEVFSAPFYHDVYDAQLIRDILSHWRADNCKVLLISKKFQDNVDQKEHWYGTEYSISSIPKEKVDQWHNVDPGSEFHLPEPNAFIPENFEILSQPSRISEQPCLMSVNDPMFRVWHKQDDKFELPKAYFSVLMINPMAGENVRNFVLHHLFTELVKDSLSEYSYNAELAGLCYAVEDHIRGLTLHVEGYNDKQNVLLEKVAHRLASYQVDASRFEVIKERFARSLRNVRTLQPYQHALGYIGDVTHEVHYSMEEQAADLSNITVDHLQPYVDELLKQLHIETLVYGNVSSDGARDLVSCLGSILRNTASTEPLPLQRRRKHRQVQLPVGMTAVYERQWDVHPANAVLCYYQFCNEDIRSKMLSELLAQVVAEPCFDVLRTQHQLGYIAGSDKLYEKGVLGMLFIVQSEFGAPYVENHIEQFVQRDLAAILDQLDPEHFSAFVDAVATKRLEKPRKPKQQHRKYLTEIILQRYFFDRDQQEVDVLRQLTLDDLRGFYNKYLAGGAPERRKLAIVVTHDKLDQSHAGGSVPDNLIGAEQRVAVDDIRQFRSTRPFWPLPRPNVDIEEVRINEDLYAAAAKQPSKL